MAVTIPTSPMLRLLRSWWSLAVGSLLGVSLLKFGNPIVLDRLIQPPSTPWEWVFQPWPVLWGFLAAAVVLASSILMGYSRPASLPTRVWIPLVWLGWQCLAATQSVEPQISRLAVAHFAVGVGLYYAALLTRSGDTPTRAAFVVPITGALALVLWGGFDQHFGGLEATRRLVYQQEGWEQLPKEYLKKLASDRVFSTLVYPNALAGAILMLFPSCATAIWSLLYRYRFAVLWTPLGLFAYFALGCLIWSGSKAGWLIGLVLVGVWLWRAPGFSRFRIVTVLAATLLGGGFFAFRFAGYFQKGATSVGARFDYWSSGLKTWAQRPVFGAGPATFATTYRAQKRPESEMALLAHNDYLEQGSDSGTVGFLAYLLLFPYSIIRLYRYSCQSGVLFSIWLGLLGWTLQGAVEFGLYIPALSWTAFFFLGWLERQVCSCQIVERQSK